MRGTRGTARFVLSAAVAVAAISGCQTTPQRKVAVGEPGLSEPIEPGTSTAIAAPLAPERKVSFADRHPLFSKPRQVYDNTGSGKVGKTAAATFIGIPSGLYNEIKQIVVGRPSGTTY